MSRWMQDEIRLLCGATSQEFNEIAEWVVEHIMWPNRREDVIAEIRLLQQRGAQIAVVSSAYQPIVEAFARRIDANPIGSPLIFQDAKLVGVTLPINSYEHKIKNIYTLFKDVEIMSAYGDTMSDIPMMELSADPVAVYPNNNYLGAKPYERTAKRKGYANGFKPKGVTTRVGDITFALPQVR